MEGEDGGGGEGCSDVFLVVFLHLGQNHLHST